MSGSPILHLTWKEYRAARAFWISMVLLVALADALIVVLSSQPAWVVTIVYHLALAAPAFFALGCAGAAFAIEQEEGTFEFLRAAPVTARQVLVSKLGLTIVATLAMYLLLWPLAWFSARGTLPEPAALRNMLGLWLVVGVEAIAWATLFSLLSARPLLAITLALFVTSTVTHLLSWSTSNGPIEMLDLRPYLTAAPWRVLLACAVLLVDAGLALRWLEGLGDTGRQARSFAGRRMKLTRRKPNPLVESTGAAAIGRMLRRPDRSTVLMRLFWLHWRQSGRLTLIILGVGILAILVSMMIDSTWQHATFALVPLAALAGLMGCSVFLVDQEQRRYRFFVEHNIPPRVVWLTRQLPWFVIVFVWSLLALLVYGIHGSSGLFWDIVYSTLPQHYYDHHTGVFDAISPVLTHLFLGLKFAMVAFAAGQWASMVVRSGLLSGFFGLLLGAVLCGWVLLMEAMSLSWLWTVLPIPLVLLWATWLRAPDWARENTQWSARFRAAAVVLIPALTLMVAVPYYRVHEIPDVSPGFEPAAYPAEITPEAKATAELYRRANELYVSVPQPIQPEPADNVGRAPHHNQLQWLKNNSESLALVLEASRSDSCALDDPATMTSITWLPNGAPLIQLIVTSGRQLEAEGKLDEALDRYLTALKVIDHWTRFALYNEVFHRIASANRVFSQLNYWASQKGQTPERIAAAIKRIGELDLIAPRIQDALESNYIITRRYLRGDESVLPVLYPNKKVSGPTQSQILWRKLMPWETTRELQRLAWATASALFRLQNMRYNIDRGKGIVDELPSLNSGLNAAHLDLAWRNIADEGSLAKCLCDFEVHRRATILILALESYQLRQGRLPETLAEIAGPDLPKLPVDPYSGRPYVYFSNGLPAPATPLDQAELQEARRYARHFVYLPSLPFIWSTGPELRSVGWRASSAIDPANPATNDSEVVVNYELRDGFGETHRLPTYQALFRGLWFAIPNPVYEPK